MRLPLPFPKCPKCDESWKQCIHKNCGGSLEINVSSQIVHCLYCDNSWQLFESRYWCKCGHVFNAVDVRDGLNTMIEISRIAMEELEKAAEAASTRKALSEASLRAFLGAFVQKLGKAAGKATWSLIEAVARLFFP
jgi:hypothetical protein